MMAVRQISDQEGAAVEKRIAEEPPNPQRILTMVVEGTARSVPEIESAAYKEFRENVAQSALQMRDGLPDEEKLAHVRGVLNEFENYRKRIEAELRDRKTEWRALVSFLFTDLLNSLGIDASVPNSAQLLRDLGAVVVAADIRSWHDRMESFLHPSGAESIPDEASQFHKADHSTENDNAAGLRGGGSAVAHVKRIMESGDKGFIGLFRLSCLNMIHQRFGSEAVEDCLMAVAAFLTQNLHSDDAIYHWSDSSLLAILQGRANEQILAAELDRIAVRNRETTINIGGRAIMLRIPITFDLTPITRLSRPEDLYKITLLANDGRAR
jgi:GGDEF domain-containing protein